MFTPFICAFGERIRKSSDTGRLRLMDPLRTPLGRASCVRSKDESSNKFMKGSSPTRRITGQSKKRGRLGHVDDVFSNQYSIEEGDHCVRRSRKRREQEPQTRKHRSVRCFHEGPSRWRCYRKKPPGMAATEHSIPGGTHNWTIIREAKHKADRDKTVELRTLQRYACPQTYDMLSTFDVPSRNRDTNYASSREKGKIITPAYDRINTSPIG